MLVEFSNVYQVASYEVQRPQAHHRIDLNECGNKNSYYNSWSRYTSVFKKASFLAECTGTAATCCWEIATRILSKTILLPKNLTFHIVWNSTCENLYSTPIEEAHKTPAATINLFSIGGEHTRWTKTTI